MWQNGPIRRCRALCRSGGRVHGWIGCVPDAELVESELAVDVAVDDAVDEPDALPVPAADAEAEAEAEEDTKALAVELLVKHSLIAD